MNAINETFYEVPPRNTRFVGRGEILEKMEATIRKVNSSSNGCPCVALHGLGGMGKTQLMLEYCYRHRTEYDHLFWLRMDGLSVATASFQKLAKHLGLHEDGLKEMDFDHLVQWVKYQLEMKVSKWLLLLDNIDEYMLKYSFENSPCIPRFGGDIILTSREHISSRIAHAVIRVGKMSEEDAIQLLFGSR